MGSFMMTSWILVEIIDRFFASREKCGHGADTKKAKPRLSLLKRGFQCPGQESNLHALRHTHLKRARLPIPPPGPFGFVVAKVMLYSVSANFFAEKNYLLMNLYWNTSR